VLSWLRDTQVYVSAAAAGLTVFDLPPSRAAKDLADWQPVLDWLHAEDAGKAPHLPEASPGAQSDSCDIWGA
jgi:chromosome partitioning protein